MKKFKRVLVTGSGGMLGGAVAEELNKQSKFVPILQRRSDVNLLNFSETLLYFKEHKPDIVVHVAARVHGLMGNQNFPYEMYMENSMINDHVLEASRLCGVKKIVAAGTVAMYPANATINIKETDLLTGHLHAGERFYAQSKIGLLFALEGLKLEHNIDFSFLLFTNLFGENDRFDETHGHVIPSLISKFSRATKNGGEVEVWGTGIAKRDFLYVQHAARATKYFIDHSCEVCTVASGNTVAIRDVVDHLSRISGAPNVIWNREMPNGQIERSYDITRLKSSGFKMEPSLFDELSRVYSHYSNLDLRENP